MGEDLEPRLAVVFAKSLAIDEADVTDELAYQSITQWDSVAHMALVAAIEEEFDIMMDTDDVIDMSSFAIAKNIVQKYL